MTEQQSANSVRARTRASKRNETVNRNEWRKASTSTTTQQLVGPAALDGSAPPRPAREGMGGNPGGEGMGGNQGNTGKTLLAPAAAKH